MKLERDSEAIESFRAYLEHASELDAGERRQMQTDLGTLTTGVVHLVLQADHPGAQITDVRVPVRGERVVNSYGPMKDRLELGIRAGHHRITLKVDGFEDAVWEFDAQAGSTLNKTFTLKKTQTLAATAGEPGKPGSESPIQASAATPGMPASVYVGAAVTGAFLAGGAITGALALSKGKDYKSANDGSNPSNA